MQHLTQHPTGTQPLCSFVSINPPVDLNNVDEELMVSFIPMDAVEDGGTGVINSLVRPLKEVQKGYTSFTNGDILWAKITPCMQNGKTGIAQDLHNGIGFGSTEFHVLRSKDESMSTEFIWEFLNMDSLRKVSTYAFTGSAGHQRVPDAFLAELPIPCINKDEQNQMVDRMKAARTARRVKLAEADELLIGFDSFLIQTLGLTLPHVDERRVFAVRYASAEERFDPHFHSPEFSQIQELLSQTHCELLGSFTTFSKETWKPEECTELDFCYIEISNVSPKTGEAAWSKVLTSEAPSRARMVVQEDDIIVSLTRPHHGSIAHLSNEFNRCIASTGFAVIRDVRSDVRRDYLWSVLRAQFCLRQMLQRSSGGNYPAITESELSKVLVPIPDSNIQEIIAKEVHRHREEVQRLRNEAESELIYAKHWFEEQLLGGKDI